MTTSDWHDLGARLGPQVGPDYGRRVPPAVPLPVCSRCGRRAAAGRVTGAEIICVVCATTLPEAALPPRRRPDRYADLTTECFWLLERLAHLRFLAGPYRGRRYDRAWWRAYRRYWRRKRRWHIGEGVSECP